MTKFYLKQNVVFRGKTYFFPGYVSAVTDDGQYVVKAFGDPATGAYKNMKHIFGEDQLSDYAPPATNGGYWAGYQDGLKVDDSPAGRNKAWQKGYERGQSWGRQEVTEAAFANGRTTGFNEGKVSAARDIERLDNERIRLAKYVDDLTEVRAKMFAELTGAQNRVNELEAVRAKTMNSLKSTLTASERECNRLSLAVNELQGYVKRERETSDNLRSENLALEAKLSEYQKLCNDLHNGLAGVTTDIRFVFQFSDETAYSSFVEVEDAKTGKSINVGRWEKSEKYDYLYLTVVGPNPVAGSKAVLSFIERNNPDLERRMSNLFGGEAEHVGTVAITDEPTHYVHCNGAAHFVKEASFFREQGGDTAEGWGRNWRPVVAQSTEEARTLSKGMDWTKPLGSELYPVGHPKANN